MRLAKRLAKHLSLKRRAYVKALIRVMAHTKEGTPGISHPGHEQNAGNLNSVTIFGVGDNNLTWRVLHVTARDVTAFK